MYHMYSYSYVCVVCFRHQRRENEKNYLNQKELFFTVKFPWNWKSVEIGKTFYSSINVHIYVYIK